MDIFEGIKLARTEQGLTQRELALKAGISVSYLSLIERGKRNPNISTLIKIANALRTSFLMLAFLGVTEDGLEKIDPDLARRIAAFAFDNLRR